MKEGSVHGSRNSFKKNVHKVFVPVLYGQHIYIKNVLINKENKQNKQNLSLWGRGFIDKNVYLSSKNEKIQSQFTIEPKKGVKSFEGNTTQPVVFGAEVLIKHVLSQQYLAINEHEQMPVLQFQQKQSSNCYFQFVPMRTFQSNGNAITTDSVFVILNSQRKLYITDLQSLQSLPVQPSSPGHCIPKKISRDETFGSNIGQSKYSNSGSASVIQYESEQIKQKEESSAELSGFKKKSFIKRINTIEGIDLQDMKDLKSQRQKFQLQPTFGLVKISSIEDDQNIKKRQSRSKSIFLRQSQQKRQPNDGFSSILNFELNNLPIYKKQEGIKNCSVENYSYSEWKFEHVETTLQTQYLNNNDYIYFTHSQSNEIMTLDIEKSPPEISFVKNTNESESQYILSSIFVVQIQRFNKHKVVYLKHFLTDSYFPLKRNGKEQEVKVNCSLIPLLSPKKNQYPPFKIEFGSEKFQKQSNLNDKYNLHGFWLNKIPKQQIAEIMSIQNVKKTTAMGYLKKYLQKDTLRRQKILREFLFIPKLIKELENKSCYEEEGSVNIKEYYQLLFYICKNNEKNKKQCLKYIEQILRYPQKAQILDLLTELLIDNSNSYVIEKSINPSVIDEQIRQFIKMQGYSISFMRIFRVFCGSDEQPSVRNQSLLFNLFFWENQGKQNNMMSESVLSVQKKLTLPDRFKFKVYEQDGEIYFSNVQQNSKLQQMSDTVVQYIRQYFYLLSDCMNGNNYPVIRIFTANVSFQLLLKLLLHQKSDLKGPVLSLIYNAYLKPQKKYKPHIFHNDYQKICVKGSLISYSNPSQDQLRDFLIKQIRENKRYNETTYRLLLNVFKMTIENGYWRKFQELLDLMNQLDDLILSSQPQNIYHNTYEEKASDRNLLRSKITALSIKISLIDMQVSLWASDYVSGVYEQKQIQHRIMQQIKHSKIWIIDQKILRLCSTKSPEMLRKAILLLYKIYNLYKLANRSYEQAYIQCESKLQLTEVFSTLQSKQQMRAQDYFIIISACVKEPITQKQLSPEPANLEREYRNLQSMFKYKQINEQVQTMAHKLGLHQSLISDIRRYVTLGKKMKQQQSDIMYWKLLTLYAIIRNNLKLRDIIAEHRKIFINLVESEASHYYVAVDIIEQIYRNNRKLIISDNQQLKNLCKCIDTVFKAGKMDLRFCKVVNLLGVFIETGNRKIVQNHQIILQYVFTKNFVQSIIKLMKSNPFPTNLKQSNELNNPNFRNVLQIVIYDLLVTMNQKKLLSYFQRPTNTTINSLLLTIGTSNWNLKSKAFLCLSFFGIRQKQVIDLMRYILYDLNIMCESLKNSNEQKKDEQEQIQMSKEVKIYISNIGKILDTIDELFKVSLKKLQKNQCEQEVLVIKIVQRLVIMKSLCPEIVHQKINCLLLFIDKIQKRKKRKNEQNSQLRMYLQNIQIGDFQKNEIKDRLPLIYSERIKNKKVIKENPKPDYLKQKTSKVEQQVKKKIKINNLNQNTFEMTDDIKKQLKTLTLSLSYVNKTDSTVLSDNIKEFLLNFMRVSFLQAKQQSHPQLFIQMQDLLVSYEVPTIICSILQEPFKHRYKLFCSAFDLSIKLLEGGHTNCQQKFLQKFKQDNKNWIFQNIYEIIFDSLTTIQFYYFYKQDPTIKSYEMILQVEQFYTCKQERKLSCELLGKAFRFLQLLCENDNHIMKQYLYNQIDKEDHIKYMTKNFVEVAQRILDGIFKVIEFNIEELQKIPDPKFQQEVRNNIFNLPLFILDFLIEVCQIPAQQNQLYLCRTDFLDFSDKIIQRRLSIKRYQQQSDEEPKDWQIFFTYQRKLIMLLKSLLQQNSQQISNLMRNKIGNKQFQFFIEQTFILGGLEDTQKLKQMLAQAQLNGYVQNIVDVLIIKKILKIEQQLNFSPQKLPIIKELNQRIQSIHVDFKTHSLTLYFPFHPLFSKLSKKTKEFMLDRSVQLKTRRQKLTEFLLSRQVVYQDINNEQNSEKKLLNQQKMGYLFNFALFLCYLIVTLLILFYSVGQSGAVLDIFEVQIISGLSFMELLFSSIYAILVGVNTYPVAKQKIKAYQAARKRQDPQLQLRKISVLLESLRIIYIDQPQSTHATVLFIISLVACFYEVRVYSFSLIFAFAKIELLQSILKSIRLTWKQLMFVCLLSIAFSFIFGFITLNYYIRPIYENQQVDMSIRKLDQHCNSIITCIISLYTQNIIGESVDRQQQQYNYGRFVSDLAYWGFFQILLSNIFAAIIIDKFAQQRNAKQKIQNQRYSKCYICFADRNTLERRGQDFMSHVDHVHNLWNYFFYMYTLQKLKDITDFTGIEYWINRQVKQNQIDWIPIDVSFKDEEVDLNYLVNKLKPLLTEKDAEEK